MDRSTKQFLEKKARDIRIKTIDMIGYLGTGHIGGAMSIVEILTVLYHHLMTIDPANPRLPDRDKLVLSKGHAGPALYATLADLGYFPEEWLHTLNRGGTNLPSHCDMNRTPRHRYDYRIAGTGNLFGCGIGLGWPTR